MGEMIHIAADWILLIGAILVAVANIAKFLGHPIKIAKKKQDEMIDERVEIALDKKLDEKSDLFKERIREVMAEELPDSCEFSNTMLQQILPTLTEIKNINLEQNDRIDILFDTSKDVLREKIMGIYHSNKATKTLKIYEKEALDQYYKDYKKEDGNSYIDRYYNRMKTWEIINSQFDHHYED